MTNELSDVFPSTGRPTITYVVRDSGENERRLRDGLTSKGQITILTGPSKTGKTSLYKQVLSDISRTPVTIRCSKSLDSVNFWANALEDLDFSHIAENATQLGGSLAGTIGVKGEAGWAWLAKAVFGTSLTLSGEYKSQIKKEFLRSQASAKHLLPLLKQLPVVLVVEDFHYLEDEVKKEVFQQWKSFVDEGVSVLVVGTTHHAVDIARANSDLIGRIRLIDLGRWSDEDLAQIVVKGFQHLRITSNPKVEVAIAKEAVGLPIIVQQACFELCSKRGVRGPSPQNKLVTMSVSNAREALFAVANEFYSNYAVDYQRLIAGPRSRAQKYKTYERVVASFAVEPIVFDMQKHELLNRIASLTPDAEAKIPLASVNSSLRALTSFQKRAGLTLLEWHEKDNSLYILEPSFLFYLRQRINSQQKNTETSWNNILKDLFISKTDVKNGPDGLLYYIISRDDNKKE